MHHIVIYAVFLCSAYYGTCERAPMWEAATRETCISKADEQTARLQNAWSYYACLSATVPAWTPIK